MSLPEMSVIDTHLPSNTKIRGFTTEQSALADIAELIWPFPTQLPPAQPSKPIPFNPENFEDAPF